jgi:sRNA-binding regulator protein Hfq
MNERYAPRPAPHRPASNGASKAPREKIRLPRPKRWSHQDELDALKGKAIRIVYTNGDETKAVLIEADQFALKVQIEGEKPSVVFKHSIAEFGEAFD